MRNHCQTCYSNNVVLVKVKTPILEYDACHYCDVSRPHNEEGKALSRMFNMLEKRLKAGGSR